MIYKDETIIKEENQKHKAMKKVQSKMEEVTNLTPTVYLARARPHYQPTTTNRLLSTIMAVIGAPYVSRGIFLQTTTNSSEKDTTATGTPKLSR